VNQRHWYQDHLPYGCCYDVNRQLIFFDRGYRPILIIDKNGENQHPTTDALPLTRLYEFWFYDSYLRLKEVPALQSLFAAVLREEDVQCEVIDSKKRLIRRVNER
jgi:hypothetical protein